MVLAVQAMVPVVLVMVLPSLMVTTEAALAEREFLA